MAEQSDAEDTLNLILTRGNLINLLDDDILFDIPRSTTRTCWSRSWALDALLGFQAMNCLCVHDSARVLQTIFPSFAHVGRAAGFPSHELPLCP